MWEKIVRWGLVAWLAGAACSGGGKYRVDDAAVADIPLGEKQELMSWQDERDRALSERQMAQADLVTAKRTIKDVQQEVTQAHASSERIMEDLTMAKDRQNVGLQQRLELEHRIARLADDVAETHLRLSKQQRKIGEAEQAAADSHLNLAEARIEQARAHFATRHGRMPSRKIPVASFDAQAARAVQQDEHQRENVMMQLILGRVIAQEYSQKLNAYTLARSQMQASNLTITKYERRN